MQRWRVGSITAEGSGVEGFVMSALLLFEQDAREETD